MLNNLCGKFYYFGSKFNYILLILLFSACSMPKTAQNCECLQKIDSLEVAALVEQDQTERRKNFNEINWQELEKSDRELKVKLRTLINEGRLNTSRDYFNAALIFTHSESIKDIKYSYELITIAEHKNPIDPRLRRAKATVWDRIQTTQDLKQWYGTQFLLNKDGTSTLLPIDETIISDEERRDLGFKPLDEIKKGALKNEPAVQGK